jgi:hypothetical protein
LSPVVRNIQTTNHLPSNRKLQLEVTKLALYRFLRFLRCAPTSCANFAKGPSNEPLCPMLLEPPHGKTPSLARMPRSGKPDIWVCRPLPQAEEEHDPTPRKAKAGGLRMGKTSPEEMVDSRHSLCFLLI